MEKLLKMLIASVLLTISASLSAQVSTWDGSWEPWTNGTGTEQDPFLIENAKQLAYLAYRVNNGLDAGGGHVSNHDYHYKLMVDVDLNGSETFQWTPIGYWNSDADYQCFGGHFDGNNHLISRLYINSSANRAGLFGFADGVTIENLSVSGGTITTTGPNAGGIVGYANGMEIRSCNNNCSVSSSNNYSYSGGIVGQIGGNTSIASCYNTGNVSSRYSGGIVGGKYSSASLIITNCYNIGNANGGIVGYGSGNVTNCYYLNTCGGNNTYGGEPKTDVYMQSLEFLEVLNNGSCAWEQDVQPYQNQGYPILTGIIVSTSTSDATNITQSHATLHGTIEVENTSVQSQGFEYKKSSDTNYQTVNVSGSGEITKTLTNLIPNTQYTYRTFCTTNGCGTDYGEEKTFTTQNVTVTTYAATNLTESSATLNGSIHAGDATVTDKGFKYWPANEPQNVTTISVANTGNISATVYGLTVNTTYKYRTFVFINNGTYQGDIQTFEVSWLNADTICVYDADMLRWVSEMCNSGVTFEGKYIKLMNNIELPLNVPNNMTSIGIYPDRPFKGTFDGNGLLITNLYIDQPNTPYQGFFGYTQNANLFNVGLVNITASGRNYTGGMVAYARNTHMRDCYVNGGTLYALSYCGGLVGYQEQGSNSIISGCYNTCTVSGNHYVGGLVGFSNYGTVRNSYVAAPVTGQGDAIGGIIGGANEVLMYNSYFSTEITGQTVAIGENNFKDGEGLTNAQMRDPQFVATMNQGLVTPVWKADYTDPLNNGFPILMWQYSSAEPCDAPENLTFTLDETSVTVNWTASPNANHYIVEYGKTNEPAHTENTPQNHFSFNIEPDVVYYWRVKSVCPYGESNFVSGDNINTDVEEIKDVSKHLQLYPNPANDLIIIRLDDLNASLKYMDVYDMTGRKLLSANIDGQSHEFSVANLRSGVYYIRVRTDKESSATLKLVVR